MNLLTTLRICLRLVDVICYVNRYLIPTPATMEAVQITKILVSFSIDSLISDPTARRITIAITINPAPPENNTLDIKSTILSSLTTPKNRRVFQNGVLAHTSPLQLMSLEYPL